MNRTILLIAAMVACASASAQDNIHPSLGSKYWITFGGYYPDHSVSLSVEGVNQIVNQEIDFEGAVGLSDRTPLLTAEFGWQFGEKWSVTAQYFETERSRNFVLDEEIEWDDVIFEVSADVTAGTDASVTRIFFSRKMFAPGQHDLRIGAGIHRMTISAFIQGTATLNDQSTEFRTEDVSAAAPLPNLGAWYRYSPSDRWVFTLRADWFSASFGDISGELIDLLAGVSCRIFNNVGIGVNYQRLSLNGRVDTDNWSGELDVVYSGPQIVISGFW